MLVKQDILGLSLILIVAGLAAAPQKVSHTGGISGVVRYPDGSPSFGATVTAVTNCTVTPGHLTNVIWVKTTSDGFFYVPPFLSSDCNHILLRAEKPEDFWLRTGREIFYESDNGTTPEVDAPGTGKPVNTEIRLGRQGGFVSVRVRDISSDRSIWAELRIERVPPAPEADFNFERISTNSPPLLLPAAQYNVFLESYSCHGKNYFTDSVRLEHGKEYFTDRVRLEPLTVEVGKKVTKDFSVDVRVIKSISSSENPEGKPCEP
jgi:hypothetical protein